MIYLLIGYVYLCIHRPFEIWESIGDLRVELIYFTGLCGAWILAPKRTPNLALAGAIVGMAVAFYFSWICSTWSERAVEIVKNYTFVVVFALILATCLRDERSLILFMTAFMVVMAIYMLHSVYEYRNGRHTFRMGIARLVGVDKSLGDPNSFGASIVYSLPFLSFFWNYWQRAWKRGLIGCYLLLAVGCVLLTGSRGSLVGVVLWGLILLWQSKNKVVILLGLMMLAAASWFVLPESLQTRFETIVDPSVGPANAQESGQGRIDGYFIGLKLLGAYPLSGVGPGAWRPASGSKIESHSLYAQLIGELGLIGLMAFSFLVVALFWNIRKVKRLTDPVRGELPNANLHYLFRAIGVSAVLLLFEGLFGHNLLRYNWGWYCALTAAALGICRNAERLHEDSVEPTWAYSISPAAV